MYGYDFANNDCRPASNKQLRCWWMNNNINSVSKDLKSVHRHESLGECKVAIVRATLHFQKVTKKRKQKRVDHGNQKVKTAAGLTTKTDNSARAIKLFAVTERIRRENFSQCAFCELKDVLRNIFFIPFLTWLSLKIQLLYVKSPTFHILKEMKLIQMKFERSQIH